MKYRMVKKEFVPKILAGEKDTTIRGKARCRIGDLVSLRYWRGKARRSKQVEFAHVLITGVEEVNITEGCPYQYPVYGPCHDNRDKNCRLCRDVIATRDGFDTWPDLVNWFTDTHGLPFRGWRISWRLIKGFETMETLTMAYTASRPLLPSDDTARGLTSGKSCRVAPASGQICEPSTVLNTETNLSPSAGTGPILDLSSCGRRLRAGVL